MEIIEDNLHPKVLKNRLFINAIEHLIEQKVVEDQKGVSARTGITEAALSNVRNDKKIVSDKTIRKFIEGFPGIFNPAYFRGENIYMTLKEAAEAKMFAEEQKRKVAEPIQPAVPDYVQKLFEEAVRMQTLNELLERQCEKLIGELREAKSDNDTFIEELRKSKEFNDTLAAELKISRTQNENLITELRETRKENGVLTAKLESAIEGIDSVRNQVSMLVSSYSTVAPTSSVFVNDRPETIEPVIRFPIPNYLTGKKGHYAGFAPDGLIRSHQLIAEEVVKKAVTEMNKEKKKKK